MRRTFATPVIALLLAGCGLLPATQSSRLHALPYSEVTAVTRCAISFAIRDFRLAGHLDRAEVVTGRSGTRLELSPADLWAAPLKEELRRSLGRSLETRWTGSRQVNHPWRFGEGPELAVEVSVDRLEPEAGLLQARIRWQGWILPKSAADSGADSKPITQGQFSRALTIDAGPAAQATAAAIARALDEFSAEVAGGASDQRGLADLCRNSVGLARHGEKR